MSGYRKTIKGSNCKNKIVWPYYKDTIERLVTAADNEFHDRKPPSKPSRRYFDDKECRYDNRNLSDSQAFLKLPSKPIKIPKPNIKRQSSCHYGGKPKKTKTKKAKKSKKVRKTNKSRKSTNFLFNLFK